MGSQANRIEEMFLLSEYKGLVPEVTVTATDKEGEEKTVNLLKAAHRLADAAIRFSDGEEAIDDAFNTFLARGDATQIAKLSPMSLVFGVWDSRGTQAKIGRCLGSTIYATNVEELTRSAQFVPSFTREYIEGKAEDDLTVKEKEKWSKAGLAHTPASGPGGVIVRGEVVKEAVLNLIALKHLRADDRDNTTKLQEYVLGLALVAATATQDYDLRQGCLLVRDGEDAVSAIQVSRDGREETFNLDHQATLEFASAAANRFGVGEDQRFTFDPKKAKDYLKKKTGGDD